MLRMDIWCIDGLVPGQQAFNRFAVLFVILKWLMDLQDEQKGCQIIIIGIK